MIRLDSNFDEVRLYFGRVEQSLKRDAARIIARYAAMIEREAEQSMTGSKSGNVYSIGGRLHTASAPYESPANLSGKLKRSINRQQSAGNRYEWKIGSPVDYARYLEHGTKNMAPRPLFKNALDKYRFEFTDDIRKMVS